MLEPLMGSVTRERVLMFIMARGEGYAREIARYWGTSVDPVLKQLDRLEEAGILAGWDKGRTRLYRFNPRYAMRKELEALLRRALEFYRPEEIERLTKYRARPRGKGKPQ